MYLNELKKISRQYVSIFFAKVEVLQKMSDFRVKNIKKFITFKKGCNFS